MRLFTALNFLHRRSKSENPPIIIKQSSKPKRRSLPLPLRAFDQWRGADTFDTAVPPANATASIPVPDAQLIKSLEQDKAQYTSAVEVLVARVAQLQGDLTSARQDLHASLVREAYLHRQTKEDEDEIVRLEEKVSRYSKFIEMMIDIGLHDNVLAQACAAIRAGQDADEALIDSIKEAATRRDSPWSKIVPTVSGSRSPEEYSAALKTILSVRRELRDSRKIAKFWKRAAKDDSKTHVDTVTPSISMISSIHEVLSEERQSRVAALMAKRRSGFHAYMTSLGHRSGLDNNSSHQENHSHADGQTFIVALNTHTPASAAHAELLSDHDSSSAVRPYLPNLPPLASESFRQELATSISYKSVSKQITTSISNIRIPFSKVDLNRPRASNATDPQVLEGSSAALGKRKELPNVSSNENDELQAHPSTPTEGLPISVSSHTMPRPDSFVEALSASLLLVQGQRRQKSAPQRVSVGQEPFENSAFEALLPTIDESDTSTVRPRPRPDESPQNRDQGGRLPEAVDNTTAHQRPIASHTVHSNAEATAEVEQVVVPDLSLVSESIARTQSHASLSPTRTLVATPTDGTPIKKSFLPVMKRAAAFSSSSPPFTGVVDMPRTTAVVTTKKNKSKSSVGAKTKPFRTGTKADSGVVAVAAPLSAPPLVSPTKSPSRLPTLSRLLPTAALRNQTRWMFDN